ncbi:MAG: carboxypeptidase-like regulatory domain-containing protein [Acidobacteriota bacterium]
MKHVVRLFSSAALMLALAAPRWAQATAGISGTLHDESGGVIPGVAITVTHTGTGVTRTAASNETGTYSLPNLPLGSYRVEATLQGFRTFTQTGLVLQVNSNPVINPVLAVGALQEAVTVTASATLVDIRTSGVGTTIETQRIFELPLNCSPPRIPIERRRNWLISGRSNGQPTCHQGLELLLGLGIGR